MSLGFGSTWGTGSTDGVVTGSSSHASTFMTWAFWSYQEAYSSTQAIFIKLNSGVTNIYLRTSGAGSFALSRQWDGGTSGLWVWAYPGPGMWHQTVITLDSSSASNIPAVYSDGISQSITTFSTPSGNLVDVSSGYQLGNRTQNDRAWNGLLANFVAAQRIWSAEEIAAYTRGVGIGIIGRLSIAHDIPMIGEAIDYMGATSTVTGCKAQPHPITWFRG